MNEMPVVEKDGVAWLVPPLDPKVFRVVEPEPLPRPDLMLHWYVGALVHRPRPILDVINVT